MPAMLTETLPEISSREWLWVQQLIEDVADHQRGAASEQLAKCVVEWQFTLRQLRRLELKLIAAGGLLPPDLELHLQCVHALLELGERCLDAWPKLGAGNLAKFGLNLPEVEAALESLRITLEEQEHGYSEEELEAVRAAIFGAQA